MKHTQNMPTFCSNHPHICINEVTETGFLGCRMSSKSTRAYFVAMHLFMKFLCDDSVRPMLMLNYLYLWSLRSTVSQTVGGGGGSMVPLLAPQFLHLYKQTLIELIRKGYSQVQCCFHWETNLYIHIIAKQ